MTNVTYQLNFCVYGFGVADGRYALWLMTLQPSQVYWWLTLALCEGQMP